MASRSPALVFALTLAAAVLSAGCNDGQKSAPAPASSTTEAEKAAQAAAESWLALVDAGKYEESWDDAAKLFRGAVDKATWRKQAEGVRGPIGSLSSRKLKSATYSRTAPGAPDGEYVILQFDATFANKQSAVETVTPMLDADGKWRVSGYFIR